MTTFLVKVRYTTYIVQATDEKSAKLKCWAKYGIVSTHWIAEHHTNVQEIDLTQPYVVDEE